MENEIKETINQQPKVESYSWYRDKKMVGMILLVVVVLFQIFAFLEVPFLSTIHAYTVGMLFGFYNPLFYAFVGYISILMIFGEKMRFPKWVKLTKLTYWFVAITIIFIGASTGYYQTLNGWTSIGAAPWNSFNAWFDKFTEGPWWAPAQTDGGIIGVFLYSLFASMLSGIGALVVAVGTLVIAVSLIASGSFIGLYKQINDKRKASLEAKELKDDSDIILSTSKSSDEQTGKPTKVTVAEVSKPDPVVEVKKVEQPKPQVVTKAELKIQEKNDDPFDFPFDDPF